MITLLDLYTMFINMTYETNVALLGVGNIYPWKELPQYLLLKPIAAFKYTEELDLLTVTFEREVTE